MNSTKDDVRQKRKETITKLRKDNPIVLYSNRIYIIHCVYNTVYFDDYFCKKLPNPKSAHDFTVELDSGELRNYSWPYSYRKVMFEHLVDTIEFLDEADIPSVFKRSIQNIYNSSRVLTKEKIAENEKYHRARLVDRIYSIASCISDTLYRGLTKGIYTIVMDFDTITVDFITNYGSYPIFESVANTDGVVRSTKEYIYYLLESEFKKNHKDTQGHDWFVLEMFDIINKAFPCVKCSYKETNGLLPAIYVQFDVVPREEYSLV